jgi:hypothetical protein
MFLIIIIHLVLIILIILYMMIIIIFDSNLNVLQIIPHSFIIIMYNLLYIIALSISSSDVLLTHMHGCILIHIIMLTSVPIHPL